MRIRAILNVRRYFMSFCKGRYLIPLGSRQKNFEETSLQIFVFRRIRWRTRPGNLDICEKKLLHNKIDTENNIFEMLLPKTW